VTAQRCNGAEAQWRSGAEAQRSSGAEAQRRSGINRFPSWEGQGWVHKGCCVVTISGVYRGRF